MLQRMIWVGLAVSFIGCSEKSKTRDTVFVKDSPTCLSQVIAGEYLVTWTDGTITKEMAPDQEKFKDSFVDENLEDIEYIESNKMIYLEPTTKASADPERFNRGGFSNWPTAQVMADSAWQLGHRGQNVVVAVIDSGVDYQHPQLASQIAINAGEAGADVNGFNKSSNGIDDDGNGYVDDVFGYNFGLETNNPFDSGNHGTHVAGIVAAHHTDTVSEHRDYVQGVAPEAKILPIAFITSGGGGTLDAAIRAIDYARIRGAHIINASWGGASCSKTLGERVRGLEQFGILFVAASGNNGRNIDFEPEYPAAYNLANQLTVGAVSRFTTQTDFSNYGNTRVHLFAPGKDVSSTVPLNGYESFSGTSMAAPMVTGALALLKSARPKASAQQLKNALLSGVDVDPTYLNATTGRLNIQKALQALP
jgi:subtilisin family serine protease